MPLSMDPQVLAALTPLVADAPEPPVAGDVETRRRGVSRIFDRVLAALPPVEGVVVDTHTVTAADGAPLNAHWYRRAESDEQGAAVLYLHGGGMIFGLAEMGAIYAHGARAYVAATGVPMLVVDYRVAPEHPDPIPVGDCYAALCWLADNAATLDVSPDRITVMGDSAGGGLAAGVTLMARDRGGPAIAQQILIYPMLDDRTTRPDPALVRHLTWSYDDNVTGWAALLGEHPENVSQYAAPARAQDLTGLPPTFIDVGDLDIFRDEDIAYAQRLIEAGVPTELHLYPGCPHAFEVLAPDAAVSRLAIAARVRRLRVPHPQ
jgi:acetyl esterase/lipase